jgi:hypothetical protein
MCRTSHSRSRLVQPAFSPAIPTSRQPEISIYDSHVVDALRTHARGAAVELTALVTGTATLNMTIAITELALLLCSWT